MFLIISFRKFRYGAWVLLWIWGVPFIIFSDSWIGSLFLIRFRMCNYFSGYLFRHAFCISETPVTLYRRPLWLEPHASFMVVFMFLLPLDSFFFRFRGFYSSIIWFSDPFLLLSLHWAFYWSYCIFRWGHSYSPLFSALSVSLPLQL